MSLRHRIQLYRLKRLPFFPVVPILPLAMFAAQGFALLQMYRKVARLESKL
jgi:hypothetical protein